jgi:hypothetical protein
VSKALTNTSVERIRGEVQGTRNSHISLAPADL